jgi:hypothetical protein
MANTSQKLWADVQSNQVVINDTITHFHTKIMLEVTFYYSVWIRSPYNGVSGAVGSTASKVCLISEQNAVKQVGACSKPRAEFQPPIMSKGSRC